MCKPTCCSSNNSSGAGAAIAALVAIVLVCAVARPVIHAAEDILHIVLIIVSALAGLAFLALVTLSFIRFRASKRPTASFAKLVRLHQVSQPAPLDWQAREIEPGIWVCDDPQRQIPAGMQPSYGMAAVLHRKIQAALEAGQEVIIIDGKSGTWS